MNRLYLVPFLATSLASPSIYAATESGGSNPSMSSTSTTSQVSSETSARRNLFTLQLLGISSNISLSSSLPEDQGVSGASISGTSGFAGISAGMESMITEQFGIEGNVAAFQKKFDRFKNADGTSEKFGNSSKLTTTRVSGMGRYHIIPPISVGAGIYTSQFVGPYRETNAKGEKSNGSFAEGFLSRLDYGATFGARGELPLTSSLSLVVDARYFLGLRNLVDARGEETPPDFDLKTRDIEVAAGLGLRF